MKRSICRFTCVALALWLWLSPTTAWAWGTQGHQIVAEIAYQRLSINAKRAVRRLLGSRKLSEVANWADNVRRDRPETGPWHYVDIVVKGDGCADAYNPVEDCPNGQCVIARITDFEAMIKDRTLDRTDRIEALKFLVHFVGDIHQPLHCAERPYRNIPRDKGGNEVKARFLDERNPRKLHSIWDTTIIEDMLVNRKSDTYADQLAKELDSDAMKLRISQWRKHDTPEAWAAESHQLAVQYAYRGIPVDQPLDKTPRLDEAYVDDASKVIREQLEKAGVRLADMLNNAFP